MNAVLTDNYSLDGPLTVFSVNQMDPLEQEAINLVSIVEHCLLTL